MAGKWEKSFAEMGAKLDELGAKAQDTAASAKAAAEEQVAAGKAALEEKATANKAALEEKIKEARGDLAAAQRQAEEAAERGKSKFASELLKAQMTVNSKVQDLKDAHDKKQLERYIDARLEEVADCHDAALVLLGNARLAMLEAVSAAAEYDARFGGAEA